MDEINIRPLTIQLNQINSNITALAIHDATNSLAIGLLNGDVLYFKNDILKYKNEKPRILHQDSHARSITALAFKNINKLLLLYMATENTIETINIIGKEKDEKKHLSSDDGTRAKCWTLTDKQQFITARKDAVFVYEHDGLGPCYPFEGEKISVHWFRGKLVIAAKENQTINRPTVSLVKKSLSFYINFIIILFYLVRL